MTNAIFAKAVMDAGCAHAVFTDAAGLEGLYWPGNGNDQTALESLVKAIKPQVMLHIHAVGAEVHQARLRLIARSAEFPYCLVAIALDGSELQRIAALQALLDQHGLKAGVVLLDNTLAQVNIPGWAGVLRGLLDDRGIIFSHCPMSAERDKAALDFARENRLDLTLGSDYWFCASTHFAKPSFPCQISGQLKVIEFGSLLSELTPVTDREKFLEISRAGVPCRFPVNGNEAFTNVYPKMMPVDENGNPHVFPYFPPYEKDCVSDGGSLMFARNLNMHGLHAYLFSAQNRLYEETMAGSYPTRYLDRLKEGVPGYEPTIYRDKVTLRGEERDIMTSFFTPPVEIEEEVVVVNAPHMECYNHWIYYLVSRFWYLDKFPELAHLPIVMCPIQIRYVEQYLRMLGIDERHRFIFYDKSVSYNLKRAYVPTVADLPFRAPANVRWLREKFLPHAAPVPEGFEGGLYYTTRDSTSHGIVNDRELLEFLAPYGFVALDWGKFTVAQQIALAKNAKIVIGEHGSNHTNLVFASPGVRHLFVQNTHTHLGADWNTFVTSDVGGKVYAMAAPAVEHAYTSLARIKADMTLFKQTFQMMMDELNQ